jgi:two-component system LytT family response regulator
MAGVQEGLTLDRTSLIVGGSPLGTISPKLLVPAEGKLILLNVADIDWVEAQGNYSILHTGATAYRMRATLRDLLARLPGANFTRVHRSAIVNLARIQEIDTWVGGRHEITLQNGAHIRLSRHNWKALKQQLLALAS